MRWRVEMMDPTEMHSRWAGVACRAVLWLGVPLLLAFPCAILLYPGGHWGPTAERGYSFSMEFLSALGRGRTADGLSNPWASGLFNGALVGCGVLYSVFFWPGRVLFVRHRFLRIVVLGCGWLMACGLAGIGLTPYDRYPRIHDTLCSATCVSGFLAILIAVVDSGSRFEPSVSRRGTLGLLAFVVAVATLVRVGIDGGWLASRPAMPLLQKGAISLMVGWTYWQVWLMSRQQAGTRQSGCPAASAEAESSSAREPWVS